MWFWGSKTMWSVKISYPTVAMVVSSLVLEALWQGGRSVTGTFKRSLQCRALNNSILHSFFFFFVSECWELHPGTSSIFNLITSPRAEDRPRVFYFGTTSDEATCKKQCAMEPLCYAYASVGPSLTRWANQCYGRGFGVPEVIRPISGIDSGSKMC